MGEKQQQSVHYYSYWVKVYCFHESIPTYNVICENYFLARNTKIGVPVFSSRIQNVYYPHFQMNNINLSLRTWTGIFYVMKLQYASLPSTFCIDTLM